MGVSADTLRKLAALNLSAEQLAGVLGIVADYVEADELRRQAARERKARSRDKSVTVTGQERDEGCDTETKKEIPPTPPKEKINNIPTNARAREAEEILTELCAVLPKDWAQAVVDHRKKLKKPLTVRAAKGLASRFAKCRDGPEAAAEAMIVNGWQGFEPEWYENAKRASKNGNHPAGTMDGLRQLLDQAKDFDNRGRDSAGSDGQEPGRRQIGAG